ncbi:MAG: hypothetical protein K2L51_06345 [Clostridiales bacterium]|nr:hypothetical protein [Clostridiales bacterium]
MHKLTIVVTGDCTGQTLTVKRNGQDAVSGTDYDYVEQTKKITFKTAGAYTLTLKAVNGEKSASNSISITIEDASATLVFGSDAFGGTWTKLKPNVGMALYFDATSHGVPLTYDDVTYTIVDNGTTAAGAQIVTAYAGRPYVIATGAGTVKVKLEATDGTDTIDYTKDFTVESSYASNDAYFKTVYSESDYMFDGTDVWVDGYNPTENVAASKYVATKEGVILAPNVSENHVESFVGVSTPYTNYTVTFDFTIYACGAASEKDYGDVYFYARNASDAEVGGLGATFGTGEKIANSFNTYAAGNALALSNVVSHHTELNAPAIGETVKLQIVKNGLASAIKISYDDGASYSDIISGNFGNNASGVMKNIYIWARGYINYAIENLTVTGNNNASEVVPPEQDTLTCIANYNTVSGTGLTDGNGSSFQKVQNAGISNPFKGSNSSTFTVHAKVNITAANQWASFMGFRSSADANKGFVCLVVNAANQWQISINDWLDHYADVPFGASQTGVHSFTIQITATQVVVFLNGVKVQTLTGGNWTYVFGCARSYDNFYAYGGGFNDGNGNWNTNVFDATYSNLAFYTGPMTEAQVAQLHSNPNAAL